MTLPVVLTIAGSDSGGGAGIQADLKTFTSLETYGCSVITAVTAQNTHDVVGIHPVPSNFVKKQLDAVLSDMHPASIKLGMLSSKEIVSEVGSCLRNYYKSTENQRSTVNCHLVVDPVLISTSGSKLLEDSAIKTLIEEILPITFILTPNFPEALALIEQYKAKEWIVELKAHDTISSMKLLAKVLTEMGPQIVVLKGGHVPVLQSEATFEQQSFKRIFQSNPTSSDMVVVDIVYDSRTGKYLELRNDYVQTTNTHGTGCTLSASIASYLALGYLPFEAITKATSYVASAIRTSYPIGNGHGPLNHVHNIAPKLIERPNVHNPRPFLKYLIQSCSKEWEAYTFHTFVEMIGNGTLPKESFVHYIIQDYLFLKKYAQAHALGAFKSKRLRDIQEYTEIVTSIVKETTNHVEFCKTFGIKSENLEDAKESLATIAYTRFVLDAGSCGDGIDLRVAIAPCLIGYGVIGERLLNDPKAVKNKARNPFWQWIETYGGTEYQTAVNLGIEKLEDAIQRDPPSESRLTELAETFRKATNLEIAFWEMGINRT